MADRNFSDYRGRYPIAQYEHINDAGTAIVLPVTDQYVNATGLLALQPMSNGPGSVLDTTTAGDEWIETEFGGPYLIRADCRISGGVAAIKTYLGLHINGLSFVPGPVPLALIPTERTDTSIQDLDQLMTLSWLIENAQGIDTDVPLAGTKIQIAFASSLNTTINLLRMRVTIERMASTMIAS